MEIHCFHEIFAKRIFMRKFREINCELISRNIFLFLLFTSTLWKTNQKSFCVVSKIFREINSQQECFYQRKCWFHLSFFVAQCRKRVTIFTEKSTFFRQINVVTEEVTKELISRNFRALQYFSTQYSGGLPKLI